VDRRDLEGGIVLTVTALAMRILAPLLLESHDLLAASVFNDFRVNDGPRYQRRSGLRRVASKEQHFPELERGAQFPIESLDFENVVHCNPILLTAAAEDRKHRQ
jgi:hypothetical protein